MRLAGRIKMAFYPTPLSVIERIKTFIACPENNPINALDPCCGEGLAVKNLFEGFDCQTQPCALVQLHRGTDQQWMFLSTVFESPL